MLLMEMLLIVQENLEFRGKSWSVNLNWGIIGIDTLQTHRN